MLKRLKQWWKSVHGVEPLEKQMLLYNAWLKEREIRFARRDDK